MFFSLAAVWGLATGLFERLPIGLFSASVACSFALGELLGLRLVRCLGYAHAKFQKVSQQTVWKAFHDEIDQLEGRAHTAPSQLF